MTMQVGFIFTPPSEQLLNTVRIELRRLSNCVVVFVPSVALERQNVNVARLMPPTVPGSAWWDQLLDAVDVVRAGAEPQH
jgi:hypothetical protein